MAWIVLAAALAIGSLVEVVSQGSLNCAYSDLQQPYVSIVEFNRSNNMFQLVDHNCQILGTSSVQPSTNYQAIGNVQDYAESSFTFGNIPVLTLEKATFSQTLRSLLLYNTSLKAFPQSWPPNLKLIYMSDMVLDIAPPNQQGLSLRFKTVTLNNITSLNNTLLSNLTFEAIPTALAIPSFDWSSLENLIISNATVSSMSSVRFSNTLAGLELRDAKIADWTMTQDTFDVLNRVNAVLVNSASTFDSSTCTSGQGKTKSLWSSRTSNFTVCVKSSSTTTNVGLVVGLAFGGAAILSALTTYYCARRRFSKLADGSQYVSATLMEDGTGIDMEAITLVRLNDTEVHLDRILGSGAFATVWLGTYDNQPVAIKRLSAQNIAVAQLQSFVDEIKLMSQFDCPYIVTLIGACWTRPVDVKCVMEYMDSGDLKEYLTMHSPEQFPWRDKYLHIQSIALALVYLHSMDIIHRDLKSRNILMDSKKGTKLTDFGISKEDLQETMTLGVGTFRWMAPEVVQDQRYTTAADIYSFGVVLSEFDMHEIPYSDMKKPGGHEPLSDSAIMVRVVAGSIKPTFSTNCPSWIHDLAYQCLSHDATRRPTAAQLANKLRRKLREQEPELFSL